MKADNVITSSFLLCKEIQQEVPRCHKRELAKFEVVLRFISDYDIAVTSNSALVLQEVFEIAHIIVGQCRVKLHSITRKDCHTMSKPTNLL